MLNKNCRHRLRLVLFELSKQEKQIEVLRQILGEVPTYEPYTAFRRLDFERKSHITVSDILEFLAQNEVFGFKDQEVACFIKHYDLDRDGELSYHEFLRVILPQDNPPLRAHIAQRRVLDLKDDEFMPYEVEYALARLLQKEITTIIESEKIKADLIEDYSFTFQDAFEAIDIYQNNYIDFYNLKYFLSFDDQVPSEEAIICALRRIDFDDDGRINFDEFIEAISPKHPMYRETIEHKIKPIETLKKSIDPLDITSPQKLMGSMSKLGWSPKMLTMDKEDKKKKAISPTKQFANSLTSLKGSQMSMSGGDMSRSKRREIKETVEVYSRNLAVKEKDWLNDLLKIFREIITLEKELEVAKQDLSIEKEFNLFDAFRIFDQKGAGAITIGDIEEAFAALSLYPNREDMYLFIRKFDRDADGKLKFSDFCEAFAPAQTEYFKLVKQKQPINADMFFDINEVFPQDTLVLFKKAIMLHLETESVTETLRQKVEKNPLYNPRRAFDILDEDRDGYISTFDLLGAFQGQKMYITEKDVNALFGRIDRDKDGKLSFVEFMQELTPKTHKKY